MYNHAAPMVGAVGILAFTGMPILVLLVAAFTLIMAGLALSNLWPKCEF